MSITADTIVANLDNTIKGKEEFLAKLKRETPTGIGEKLATNAVIHFLGINIAELRRIRDDVAAING